MIHRWLVDFWGQVFSCLNPELLKLISKSLAVLHYACYAGMITLVRALLEGKFFDVDVTGTEADTRPIHSAAAGGYFAVVKYGKQFSERISSCGRVLLEKGASVKPTKNGLSPLHSAVSRFELSVQD